MRIFPAGDTDVSEAQVGEMTEPNTHALPEGNHTDISGRL